MKLLFVSTTDRIEPWRKAFSEFAPDIELVAWPDVPDPDAIEFAAVWKYPPGELKRFRNLKFVSSLGAGIDHLLGDPDFPKHVPFVRLVDPTLTSGMVEYALWAALRYHRQILEYETFQRAAEWHQLPAPSTAERRIGIAGTGEIGSAIAKAFAGLGFDVAGWSRRGRAIDGVQAFAGAEGWVPFLARTDILVCVLPLTAGTKGILDARAFAALPKGAYVINIARGGHVVDRDLLAALDCGQLAHATLDVTTPEPLPADHAYWRHTRVTITPHVASLTDPRTAVPQVVDNIRRFISGQPLVNRVDRENGY
ncbi:MAG: glyoxylate/hydroxypyruvate reductase A [Alphaproteobacteria bacterium]|nr:glyoxylate/hydroxypyruvate reductase A [Alphaproteobacteria bacterium]